MNKLPADLPENWKLHDAVTPNGNEAGLDEKHGFNYLMKQVNKSHTTINELIDGNSESNKAIGQLQTRVDSIDNNKVDKVTSKGLSTNDYTSAEKTKLAGLSNYNDAQVKSDITQLQNNKVDKVAGKGLSTNDYTTAEKSKLAGLSNYDDTQIKADITAANTAIGQLQTRTDSIDAEVQALKQYPINESLTLLTANWSDTTPSTYTVTDSRYTAAISDWDIKPGINITEAESEALSNADIDIDGSHDGYFTLTTNGDKPMIDLPILVKIWRL